MSKTGQGPRLKRNERGVYEIHWSDDGRSKRSSTRTSDLQSAQKVLAAFLTIDGQERRSNNHGPRLVMDALGNPDMPDGDDYWHEHVMVNVIDKDRVGYDFAKLLPFFGAMAIRDIMPADVRRYVKDRRAGRIGRPSVNHTISRELATLNAALVHDVKEKRLSLGEKPFIELPGTSPPRDRWLTYEEAESLLSAALASKDPHTPEGMKPRIYRFVMLALETASRKTALLELKRSQVDLQHSLIYLNPTGRQQTKKRRPQVKISSRLRPVIEETLLAIPDKPGAHLLGHAGCIRTAFENAVERAGLGTRDAKGNLISDVTPHTLRHTKATWMAQAGVDMWKIANVLGDTLATVEKNYAHHHPDYQTEAVEVGPGQPKLRVVGGTA
jgi:integrase